MECSRTIIFGDHRTLSWFGLLYSTGFKSTEENPQNNAQWNRYKKKLLPAPSSDHISKNGTLFDFKIFFNKNRRNIETTKRNSYFNSFVFTRLVSQDWNQKGINQALQYRPNLFLTSTFGCAVCKNTWAWRKSIKWIKIKKVFEVLSLWDSHHQQPIQKSLIEPKHSQRPYLHSLRSIWQKIQNKRSVIKWTKRKTRTPFLICF